MFRINYDALGISASLACAIHCAILPLLFTTVPVFGLNIIHNIYFEGFMILLALSIGVISLTHGYKRHHHRLLPLTLFVVGILLLFAKEAFPGLHLALLLPAIGLIIVAHYLNYRYCRLAKSCHATDCRHS